MKDGNYNNIILDALNQMKKGNIKECENRLRTSLIVCPNIDLALNIIGICRYYYCDFQAAEKAWNISYTKYNSFNAKMYLDYMESKEGKAIITLYYDAVETLKKKKYVIAKRKFQALLNKDESLIVPKRIISIINYRYKVIKDIPNEIEDKSNIHMVLNNYKYLSILIKRYIVILTIVFLLLCYILGYLFAYN